MAKHFYGYVQDKQDDRDFMFQAVRPPTAPLPASVDLRHLCSPVRDQGQLGSCTGFAIAVGFREFLLVKLGVSLTQLSPLFLYYEERKLEHDIQQDGGAQPRDGMKVLAKMGCAPESDDPYNISVFTKAPSTTAVKDAAQFKVYESFESQAVAQTGKMPMPAASEAVVGGHAVFAAGYQTDPGTAGGGFLIVKNSWGTGWGDQGYFYMPFAYVTPALVSDAWTGVA